MNHILRRLFGVPARPKSADRPAPGRSALRGAAPTPIRDAGGVVDVYRKAATAKPRSVNQVSANQGVRLLNEQVLGRGRVLPHQLPNLMFAAVSYPKGTGDGAVNRPLPVGVHATQVSSAVGMRDRAGNLYVFAWVVRGAAPAQGERPRVRFA